MFDALHNANHELGFNEREEVGRNFQPINIDEYDPRSEVRFMGGKFRLAEEFNITTSCNKDDLTGIGNWIRGARRLQTGQSTVFLP